MRIGKTQHTISYRCLVVADGPYSKVAGVLGLPKLDTIVTRQYTVALTQYMTDSHVWLSKRYRGGYAWLFPKRGKANLGLGLSRSELSQLKPLLDRHHRNLARDGVVASSILSMTGGPIPVGGLRTQLVMQDILFIGDAGGFTHPITGAGIAAAAISADCAAHAVYDYLQCGSRSALDDYEQEMRDMFEAVLAKAVVKRRRLLAALEKNTVLSDCDFRAAWIAYPEYAREMKEFYG